MFITSALLYISSVLLSSVFLKLTFLFFTGIFQLTPPSLPLAYPPPPSPIHAAQIRPKKRKNNRPGAIPGRRFIYSISIFQSGFALAAGELTIQYTRFRRLYISILANSFISAARSSGLFAHLLTHSGKW
jgi:hypothetical protein